MFDEDEVDGIAGKWFMTFGSDSRETICEETLRVYREFTDWGLTILRWKVEETIADSKAGHDIGDLVKLGRKHGT